MICIFSGFAGVFFIITRSISIGRSIFVLFSFAPTITYFLRKHGAFLLKALTYFLYMRVCVCVKVVATFVLFLNDSQEEN